MMMPRKRPTKSAREDVLCGAAGLTTKTIRTQHVTDFGLEPSVVEAEVLQGVAMIALIIFHLLCGHINVTRKFRRKRDAEMFIDAPERSFRIANEVVIEYAYVLAGRNGRR